MLAAISGDVLNCGSGLAYGPITRAVLAARVESGALLIGVVDVPGVGSGVGAGVGVGAGAGLGGGAGVTTGVGMLGSVDPMGPVKRARSGLIGPGFGIAGPVNSEPGTGPIDAARAPRKVTPLISARRLALCFRN